MSPDPALARPPKSRRRRLFIAAAALALAVAAFAALFDWDWLRPAVERYLSHRSGREVRAGHLAVEWPFGLEPTVRFTDVYIANAPWAARRPFVTAREIAFTVRLPSVAGDAPTVVPRLELVDADVDMERLANGLRNWRLTDPGYTGPGRVTVQTLVAQRSRIRFVNGELGLELTAASGASEAPGSEWPVRIAFEGAYKGAPFSGAALTGPAISFRGSGASFPLRGHIVSRGTRLELDGRFTDVFDLGPMRARLQLAGPTLSQLHPFLAVHPPPSRPYRVEAQLAQGRRVYEFTAMKGRIGDSALSGEATYDRRGERPSVRAIVRGETVNAEDVRPLLGLREFPGDGGRLVSATPLRLEPLDAIDARAFLAVKKLAVPGAPPIEDARMEATLERGLLRVTTIDLGIAGGHATGTFTFDARSRPPSAEMSLALRALRVERLAPGISDKARAGGTLEGRVALRMRGVSAAALLGTASGTFALRLNDGRMSNVADAKLGMDYGRLLRAFVSRDREIAIRCGVAAFDIRNGVGRSTALGLETDATRVDGGGTIDLNRERLDLTLEPEPKKPGLFTRHAAIRVNGPLMRPAVSTVEKSEAANGRPAWNGC